MFAHLMEWIRVVDKLPEDGKSYLVWTGSEIVVSCAHVYDAEHKARLNEAADSWPKNTDSDKLIIESLRNATGKFADFGVHWYFDNPKVYYAELPSPPV